MFERGFTVYGFLRIHLHAWKKYPSQEILNHIISFNFAIKSYFFESNFR